MGLTVYYNLDLTDDASEDRVRELVGGLRDRALTLPAQRVTTIHRMAAGDAEPQGNILRDLDAYVRHSATASIEHPEHPERCLTVPPIVAYGFGVMVGRCEPVILGLGRYPRTVPEGEALIDTGLRGWRWHSFTKTQYASVHGIDRFLACHRAVIALLEAAAALGITVSVRDDSGYWDHRDETRLLASLYEWNRVVARIAGRLASAVDGAALQAVSPVFRHPDFERLEM